MSTDTDSAATTTSAPTRLLTALVGALIVMSPPLLAVSLEDDLRFQWRMFSAVGEEIRYEIQHGSSWDEAELSGLSWWQRERHIGPDTLEQLCDRDQDVEGARRLIDDEVDVQVVCS
ncbi:MAG: hypothetical protein ACLFWR_13550 [Acidimicrobiales bacterium]